jgi:hypothetical protein
VLDEPPLPPLELLLPPALDPGPPSPLLVFELLLPEDPPLDELLEPPLPPPLVDGELFEFPPSPVFLSTSLLSPQLATTSRNPPNMIRLNMVSP